MTSSHLRTEDPPLTPHRLELDKDERARFRVLCESLAETEPKLLDETRWQSVARDATVKLPHRLSQTLRAFRHDPGSGVLVISGLPVAEGSLPSTPSAAGSVQRIATPSAAAAILIGQVIGEVVAFRQEKGGALVQDVVPVRGFEESQSNAGSVPLEFHTENAFHPCRPDYVGLTCLRQAHDTSVGTLVCSVRVVAPRIDDADRKVLHQARFVTNPPPSFNGGAQAAGHPVLEGSWDDPNVRLDFNSTVALDEEAREALDRLRVLITENCASANLTVGEMALVDNRTVLHGRAPFTPRYDGQDRWLQRVFIHLDNRRSREYRPDNGPIME